MSLWLGAVIAVAIWILLGVLVLALCRAAAKPTPLRAPFESWRAVEVDAMDWRFPDERKLPN